MKILIFLATLCLTMLAVTSSYEEPKDSFILFGNGVDSSPPPVVKSTPKATPTPTKKPVALTSWKFAKASHYGGSDGFYYNKFACGGAYYPNVVGVAHKTLPCGTKVQFKHWGTKKINGVRVTRWWYATIRVIDRGPYCCGRSWDFTTAAAKLLAFGGIGNVYWRLVRN